MAHFNVAMTFFQMHIINHFDKHPQKATHYETRSKTNWGSQVVEARHIPEPATPTVAAPAPMNLAAESISRVTDVVWNDRTCGKRATGVVFLAAKVWLWQMTALLNGRK